MAQVVITLKVMPGSPDTNLGSLEKEASKLVSVFGGEVGKVEVEPVAFGLKALKIYFVMDESKGATDDLEKQISEIEDVNSVEIIDVRRTIG